MAITVLAAITDQGRAAFADLTVNGTSFVVNIFEVGNGGHDPGNPIVALTPDASLGELPSITFGPEPVEGHSERESSQAAEENFRFPMKALSFPVPSAKYSPI